ncbi:MAG: hypothetical protein IKI49_05840 [Oscillospiraceae bacterium]|nr:hypothetical protein [Oscillospiraceae bacterium]
MKIIKNVIGFLFALAIAVCLNACVDSTQKRINESHRATESAYQAAKEAQRNYDQLIRDYERYKRTQEKLG